MKKLINWGYVGINLASQYLFVNTPPFPFLKSLQNCFHLISVPDDDNEMNTN